MKLLACSLLLCLLPAPAPGWAQSTFGTIRGTVSDDKGALITEARVRLTNLGESATREVATDTQGNFEAPNL